MVMSQSVPQGRFHLSSPF
uniref:Uncharacterized protein n=1 Tax=Arundo donax TaxID=35708 RepID=A0A0A8ZN34_ARUDO